MIVVIKEGTILSSEPYKILEKVAETYFKDSPFIYITNRIYSYSVDPIIYKDAIKISNLKGFAVVSKNYQAKVNAKIEQQFYKKPFEIFSQLDDAIQWAESFFLNP